jgi:hypothetical protein
MRDNNSTKWSMALPIVMFKKNMKYHSRLKLSPFKSLFGCEGFLGLEELNLPANELDKINTARDLFNLYGEYFLISLSLFLID